MFDMIDMRPVLFKVDRRLQRNIQSWQATPGGPDLRWLAIERIS